MSREAYVYGRHAVPNLNRNHGTHHRSELMKDPNFPVEQPKDPVSSALTDRNADPSANVQAESLKVHGDPLSHPRPTPQPPAQADNTVNDAQRDEGF